MKYEIIGYYENCKAEVIDEAMSREYALQLMRQYKTAFGDGWRIIIKKIKNN